MILEKRKRSRLRLDGKKVSKEDIAQKVAQYLLGNPAKRILPIGATEISRRMNFSSTKTVYNYRDLAIQLGFLKKGVNGDPQLPEKPKEWSFKRFDKKHPIVNDNYIPDWKQDLFTRKQGNPIESAKQYLRCVEIVCNTLRIPPEAFLESLDKSEKLLKNFLEIYKKGEADMTYVSNPQFVDMSNIAYQFSKGIRDFMNFYNLRYPKGKKGVMSQTVPNHAKYADVKFIQNSEIDEVEIAEKYMIEKFGIDSDEYRSLFLGIQSCARGKALLNMKMTYVKTVSKEGKITYLMEAYESKTKHINQGKWQKYIITVNLQKSIDLHKSRGGYLVYDLKKWESIGKFEKHLKKVLIDLYIHLGKIPNIEELREKRKQKIKNTGNYWFDHSIHVLRHVGAHYWLAKGNYANHVIVAEIGGWHTIDEMIKSYGKIPPEKVLEELEKFD